MTINKNEAVDKNEAIELLHEIAFFQMRVDARLSPQYERGWNDAVDAITAIDADNFGGEVLIAPPDTARGGSIPRSSPP